MRLKSPGTPKRREAPDLPQEFSFVEDSIRLSGEPGEELELLRRERDRRVPNRHAPRSPIDDEPPGDQHLGRRLCAPSQERTNTREQLFVGEGRPMTSSAPRSSARTRSTGSDEGASRMTGTFRSHVRPGSPRRSRRHRSSSVSNTTSGRMRSASSRARSAAPPRARRSRRRGGGDLDTRASRVPALRTRTALGMPPTLVACSRRARCPLRRKRVKASSAGPAGPGSSKRLLKGGRAGARPR